MNKTRQLQMKELEIAKTIISICEKHNLRWYGWFGTAIGAVRHNGFIPWDEDLDLALPEEDYDELAEIMEKELPYPLEVLRYAGQYRLEHIVVHDTSTTFIDKNRIEWPEWYRGIFIDIFPLRGMPSNHISQVAYFTLTDFLNKSHKYHRYDISACPTWKSKLVYLFVPDKATNRVLDWLTRRYPFENADYYGFNTEIKREKHCYKKETISNYVEIPFEDIMMRLPSGYHQVLTQEYGDYMVLPPPEKRELISEGGIIDFDVSYRYYINKKRGEVGKEINPCEK